MLDDLDEYWVGIWYVLTAILFLILQILPYSQSGTELDVVTLIIFIIVSFLWILMLFLSIPQLLLGLLTISIGMRDITDPSIVQSFVNFIGMIPVPIFAAFILLSIFLIIRIFTTIIVQMNSWKQRRRFEHVDPLAPKITKRWAKKALGSHRTFDNNHDNIIKSIKLLLAHLREHDSLPTKREMFDMGTKLETIKLAIKLLDTDYKINPSKDLRRIQWRKFDDHSKKIIQTLEEDPAKYNLESILLDTEEEIVSAKLFLAVFPLLENATWVKNISRIDNKISLSTLDSIACKIVRLQYREKGKDLNILSLAYRLDLGLISVLKGLDFAEEALKQGVTKISLEPDLIYEKARDLSRAEKSRTIKTYVDPGEVAEKLNLDSLSLTLAAISFFTEDILEETTQIEAFQRSQDGLKLQKNIKISESRLQQEVSRVKGFLFPFHCQTCQQRKGANISRYQCQQCNRFVCKDCYEISTVAGFVQCPMCEGVLEKL